MQVKLNVCHNTLKCVCVCVCNFYSSKLSEERGTWQQVKIKYTNIVQNGKY